MAKIIPFRGVLYNNDKVSGDDVVAPPYDIISPEFREALYLMSPYNIIQVDFGREMPEDTEADNKYSRASKHLEDWLQKDILINDSAPSIYLYEVDYEVYGRKKLLRGFLCLVRIEELGNGIYPHEETHAKPKKDRLSLMRSCGANTSPIYSLFDSPESAIDNIFDRATQDPYITARDAEGSIHRLYKLQNPGDIETITKELSDKPIFIADGHHRYEVALEFKHEMDRIKTRAAANDKSGDKPWDYVMMFLANLAGEGITILPTHRIIKGLVPGVNIHERLSAAFTIQPCELNPEKMQDLPREDRPVFGLYVRGAQECSILKYKGGALPDIPLPLRRLDVVVLHELILKRTLGVTDVAFEMDPWKAIRQVQAEGFDAAFFLNPTSVGDVKRVALANFRMPPKSTYFYPKLLTGLVINSFKNF